MSESTSADSPNGDGIPSWMAAVSEETFYNAEGTADTSASADETEAYASSPDEASPSPQSPSKPPASSAGVGSLTHELALSMAEPSNIPAPDPTVQPTVVGRVRSDLDDQLEKAVSVLGTRYAADVPRTLVLEFALHRTLRALREEGVESPLVQWLDSILPRR